MIALISSAKKDGWSLRKEEKLPTNSHVLLLKGPTQATKPGRTFSNTIDVNLIQSTKVKIEIRRVVGIFYTLFEYQRISKQKSQIYNFSWIY